MPRSIWLATTSEHRCSGRWFGYVSVGVRSWVNQRTFACVWTRPTIQLEEGGRRKSTAPDNTQAGVEAYSAPPRVLGILQQQNRGGASTLCPGLPCKSPLDAPSVRRILHPAPGRDQRSRLYTCWSHDTFSLRFLIRHFPGFAPRVLAVLLCIAGLGGAMALLYTTRLGIGLWGDSMDYIATAKSISAGAGIKTIGNWDVEPLRIFPPLYPICCP